MKNSRLFSALLVAFVLSSAGAAEFPGAHWESAEAGAVGLSREKLQEFQKHVGGRGVVVRHGKLVWQWGDVSKSSDVASAFKPLLTFLMLEAVQEKLIANVDEPVSVHELRLSSLNDGKDAKLTWRHLANQISGYGLEETPGAAYSYNDYALALYYDTLMGKVFRTNGTAVLRARIAEPLEFEDAASFEAFGPKDRPGRLAVSVRDFARFGVLILNKGKWGERQLLRPDLFQLMFEHPLPADKPITSGREAAMLPKQRTIGGGKTITRVGPGFYSFNWWLNGTNSTGQRLLVDGPEDMIIASGHGGKRSLWIFPNWDLVAAWNDSPIDDHDQSPGNPISKCNIAVRLLSSAVVK